MIIKQLFLVTALFLIASCSSAQQYSSKNKKAIKLFEMGKSEPSNTIDERTHTPNFRGGLVYLNQAIEKDPSFWEAHMVAGEFCETLGDYRAAIDHYKKALAINPQRNTTGSSYFFLANLEQAVGDYDNAIRNIDFFQQFRNANPELIKKSHEIRANCVFAKESMLAPIQFNPMNIGPGINTAQPEYFPTITVDGKTILFTRRIKDGRVRGEIAEQEDFFVSQLGTNNIWG
ncbi:MAG: tetratricopeptide repeat protein, partial [Flavobacteriales bacterium]|nr:tetratricopeptide repeat protein [Flavobacteriales bacterium]